jgi:hypothetical protein
MRVQAISMLTEETGGRHALTKNLVAAHDAFRSLSLLCHRTEQRFVAVSPRHGFDCASAVEEY